MKKQLALLLTALFLPLAGSLPAFAEVESCHFLPQEYSYEGTAIEQARCLMRPVSKGGRLPESAFPLPAPIENLVGQPVSIDKQRFRDYLDKAGILENSLGGSLDDGLSYANDGDINSRQATYFVIHDTSTPDYGKKAIPANINSPAWKYNQLWRYPEVAHVFINRLGESASKVNFNIPFRATKYESKVVKEPAKGLYLHIELLQPRRDQPRHYKKNNALIAPSPGFTNAQYKRLALVYTAASLRGGRWLIPTFHAVVDFGLYDAHDDPQNFSREQFASELLKLLKNLGAEETKGLPAPPQANPAKPANKKQKTPHRR
ncbi:MAG TPA: hypothetical protein VFM46_03165 [Pseudomonadales bacterium]|nr:hypothetical protein [Pseudomonadales bacterium]